MKDCLIKLYEMLICKLFTFSTYIIFYNYSEPRCTAVLTSEGVPISVTGTAQVQVVQETREVIKEVILQVKVMKERRFLRVAAEQLLGKTRSQLRQMLLATLEGHLRYRFMPSYSIKLK